LADDERAFVIEAATDDSVDARSLCQRWLTWINRPSRPTA